jgi:hypothetical protein
MAHACSHPPTRCAPAPSTLVLLQDLEQLLQAIGAEALTGALGSAALPQCSAKVVDATPACTMSEAERAQHAAICEEGAPGLDEEEEKRVAVVRLP